MNTDTDTQSSFHFLLRASIPMGQGGHVPPNIYEGGTSMVMSLPSILEVMSFRMSTRVTATVVCCILT